MTSTEVHAALVGVSPGDAVAIAEALSQSRFVSPMLRADEIEEATVLRTPGGKSIVRAIVRDKHHGRVTVNMREGEPVGYGAISWYDFNPTREVRRPNRRRNRP